MLAMKFQRNKNYNVTQYNDIIWQCEKFLNNFGPKFWTTSLLMGVSFVKKASVARGNLNFYFIILNVKLNNNKKTHATDTIAGCDCCTIL